MAPPPPASLPLQERLLALVKTLQFAWFAGHFTLILCIIRYTLSWIRMNYNGTWARFSYRLAFVSAALTYGIVVYKTWRSRQKAGAKQPGGPIGYLADENIQYLVMAIVWLFSPQYLIAMLPYGIYSVFHVATYVRTNLIPTIQPPQVVPPPAGTSPGAKPVYAHNATADMIGTFVKEYYDTSMSMVSMLEILIWVRLALSALLLQQRSWILLGIYTVFLRARFAQSSHVQNSFGVLEARGDALLGAQGTHPSVRQAWEVAKGGARQFHDLTDVNKHVNGAAAPPKKTS